MKASFALFAKIFNEGYGKKVAEQFGDQTDFANRKVLFTMGSTSAIPFYDAAIKQGAGGPFAWSVAPIPGARAGTGTSAGARSVLDIYGASVSVVKSTPERQLAAWLFLGG